MYDRDFDDGGLSRVRPGLLLAELRACDAYIPILTPSFLGRIVDRFGRVAPAQGLAITTELRYGPYTQRARSGGLDDGWVADEFWEFFSQDMLRARSLGIGMPLVAILRSVSLRDLPEGFPFAMVSDFRDVDGDVWHEVQRDLDKISDFVRQFARRFPLPPREQ